MSERSSRRGQVGIDKKITWEQKTQNAQIKMKMVTWEKKNT